MTTNSTIRAHLFISGRVQGVFFRDTTRFQAQRAGVGGWVRNLPDGRVEAVFEGARAEVEELIRWSHAGPPHARVEQVEVAWEEPRGETAFRVR